MRLTDLKIQKNLKLLALEEAKKCNERHAIFDLGSEVAKLEGLLARSYLKKGENEKAVVNLISQASCLLDSNRRTEAVRIYEKAESITHEPKTKDWLRKALQDLLPIKIGQSIFTKLLANIENNRQLRIPQIEAYQAARSYFSEKIGHAIIQLPVGCGKTGAMSIIPFNISTGRVLALAPNLEIRRNLYENLNYHNQQTSFLRRFDVLKNGEGPGCAFLDSEANIHDCDSADIVVTNIQQLASKSSKKWLSKLSPDFFDMILIDEAHHNVATTWLNSIKQFPDAKIVSFTATPLRADGKKVEGERVYRFPISQAIKDGYIKDIASRRLVPEEIYFTYKDENRRVQLDEVLKLRENEWFSKGVALSKECNKTIVDASIQSLNELRQSGEKHQIIAVACSIDHAKSVRTLYEERGLMAVVIHSQMKADEQDEIRRRLKDLIVDVIVQVQMLGEGADYPHLSVASIFRPFRHLMPYVQFVGRIMRVIRQNAAGDPVNRGFVVSHVGLNVDRWWDELRYFDRDDEEFFSELALGEHEFLLNGTSDSVTRRRRFKTDMTVIEEAITHFVQERFLPEDAKLVVDDLISAMNLRGIDFDALGLTREDLEKRLLDVQKVSQKRERLQRLTVSPQEARKAARQRLNERVRSGAKELLNELGLSVGGYELPRMDTSTGAQANLPAAIILLNRAILDYLNVGPKERDILTSNQLEKAHDNIDEIIDDLSQTIRNKRG